MLASHAAEADSGLDEAHRMEERLHVAEMDSEAIFVIRVHVDQLTAQLASLTTGTKQAKAERRTMAARIWEL